LFSEKLGAKYLVFLFFVTNFGVLILSRQIFEKKKLADFKFGEVKKFGAINLENKNFELQNIWVVLELATKILVSTVSYKVRHLDL